jgi:RimJ/RimL family protein N-acetyltransferase
VEATELRTRRLVLRRLRPSDGPGLHAYLSRPEAVRFEPYPVQDADACDRLAADRTDDPDFWAVCLGDGTLVGHLWFSRCVPEAWGTWELGYVFHPDHWGRGYATEAAAAIVTACFTEWGGRRVVARCDPANPASWRLLERLGLRREGHLRQNASFESDAEGRLVWKDTYLYAVLATEWAAHHP